MIVVVGDSSTGKSRACYEAVVAVLPDWPVERPTATSPTALIELLSGHLPNPVVIWLDEIHTYLTGDSKDVDEAVAAVEQILYGQSHVVLLGTTWRQHWQHLTRLADPRIPGSTAGPGARWLNLPAVVVQSVVPDFTDPQDLENLRRAAMQDPVLAEALHTAGRDRHITQVLAGGPQQLSAYHARGSSSDAVDRAAWAVLTAAIDTARLGHTDPPPADALRIAAPGYLDQRSRVLPMVSWFDDAVADASRPIHGTHALTPLRTHTEPGRAEAYLLHDYMTQHAARQRRYEPIPDTTWKALERSSLLPERRIKLVEAAAARGLFLHAHQFLKGLTVYHWGLVRAELYRLGLKHAPTDWLGKLAEAGDPIALDVLAPRTGMAWDEQELRTLAAAGNPYAQNRLAELAIQSANEAQLPQLVAAGNRYAQRLLNQLAIEAADEAQLPELAAAGNQYAQQRLLNLAADRGDEAGLRILADTGNPYAQEWLAKREIDHSNEAGLWELAAAGNRFAKDHLLRLAVRERFSRDEPVRRFNRWELQVLADAGDFHSHDWLLRGDGNESWLWELADEGNHSAMSLLADLAQRHGDMQALQRLRNAGDLKATKALLDSVIQRHPSARWHGLSSAGGVEPGWPA